MHKHAQANVCVRAVARRRRVVPVHPHARTRSVRRQRCTLMRVRPGVSMKSSMLRFFHTLRARSCCSPSSVNATLHRKLEPSSVPMLP
eukprot:4688320-Pleurochrysis_carterae.AAC.2